MACFLLSFVLKAKASFNINNKILGIGYKGPYPKASPVCKLGYGKF